MPSFVVSETLHSLLPNLSRLVVFCDERERVLGHFFPETPLFRMTRVIVNETLRSLLPDLSQRLEFCDENGKVLGRFHPETPVYIGKEPPPLTEKELRLRETEESTYTTAEVMAYLERLESGIE